MFDLALSQAQWERLWENVEYSMTYEQSFGQYYIDVEYVSRWCREQDITFSTTVTSVTTYHYPSGSQTGYCAQKYVLNFTCEDHAVRFKLQWL
jgi:hypothetical protein